MGNLKILAEKPTGAIHQDSTDSIESYLVDFGMSINWANEYGLHEPSNQTTAQVI